MTTEDSYKRGNLIVVNWYQRDAKLTFAQLRLVSNLCEVIADEFAAVALEMDVKNNPQRTKNISSDLAEAFADASDLIQDGVTSLRFRLLLDMMGMEIQFATLNKTISTAVLVLDQKILEAELRNSFFNVAGVPIPDGEDGGEMMEVLISHIAEIQLTRTTKKRG